MLRYRPVRLLLRRGVIDYQAVDWWWRVRAMSDADILATRGVGVVALSHLRQMVPA